MQTVTNKERFPQLVRTIYNERREPIHACSRGPGQGDSASDALDPPARAEESAGRSAGALTESEAAVLYLGPPRPRGLLVSCRSEAVVGVPRSRFVAVRVLLASSLGGAGHLTPVVAAARACTRLGHDVLLLVPPSLAAEVERTGLPYRVGRQPSKAFVDEIWARLRAGGPGSAAGLIDRELFAERATQTMLSAARAARDDWQPDLVVREPCEYASAIAAHEAGIAQAQLGISLSAIDRGVLDMVTPIIEQYGPGVAGAVGAAPYISSFPASLDPSPWAITRRFHTPAPAARELPEWWPSDEHPLVYLTFGSVTGHLLEAADVYRSTLDAVSGLAVRVLLTVGRSVDIDGLGPMPANTHVEQWVPQADVFAHAAVVVCHGGSGTTFGALAAGVPLVICPLFADQPRNGQLVQAAGAGRVVAGRSEEPSGLRSLGPADVAPLREAIELVLREPAYRRAAERISAEMMATPMLDDVIERDLAKGHR